MPDGACSTTYVELSCPRGSARSYTEEVVLKEVLGTGRQDVGFIGMNFPASSRVGAAD
jgi:hypothetical protein